MEFLSYVRRAKIHILGIAKLGLLGGDGAAEEWMRLHQCGAAQRLDKEEATRWKYEATSRCDKSNDTHSRGCEGFGIEVSGWHDMSYDGCLIYTRANGWKWNKKLRQKTRRGTHLSWLECDLMLTMRSCAYFKHKQVFLIQSRVNVITNQFEFVTQIRDCDLFQ